MSHLTTATQLVWVAILYDEEGNFVEESYESITKGEAIAVAKDMIAKNVINNNQYTYANIISRVIPLYQ